MRLNSKRIKNSRKSLGLSQAQLAKKLGVSQGTVSNWENKQLTPDAEQLEALQRLFSEAVSEDEESSSSPVADWVKTARIFCQLSVPELAVKSGLSAPAVYRIEAGKTINLQAGTRKKLESVLGPMPADTAEVAAEEATVLGLGALEDFDPHTNDERPSEPGIYVFYDISDRPIYVGEGGNVKRRIRDHEEKFWFKRPIVESASWIKVEDSKLRRQMETIMIKFLKSNAVINKQNVERNK